MKLTIKRVALTPVAAYGVLLGPDGVPFSLTLERPWVNNQSGISCIPAARGYKARRCRRSADYNYSDSPKFGDTFQVIDVPGRQYILFHKGNLASDSHGCILIGEKFDMVNGVPGVTESAQGFGQFLALTSGCDEFDLDILEV